MPLRVAVVEDEPAIRRAVADLLRLAGYAVVEAADGQTGLAEATADGVDLLLLDVVLPRRDGLAILAAVRQSHPTRPVILLTARGSEDDRVRGLKLGADDYVVKPFSARELLARVEAVMRRANPQPAAVARVTLHDAVIDLARRDVTYPDGTHAELSETEAAVLAFLLQHRDRAVSREELLARIWGLGAAGEQTRAIDMHVLRLRAKLRDAESIETVRGRGYRAGAAFGTGGTP